ncbi:MAG: ribonuclease HII [Chthoniobacterales bacterium]
MGECDFSAERSLKERGVFPVAGIDEAGRGPLAGPVVAAAVVIEDFSLELRGLNDSKKLSEKKREELFEFLSGHSAIHFCVAEASSVEIDALNILRATHLAMRRAVEGLMGQGCRPIHCLVDGLAVKGLPLPHDAIVKGDASSLSIAAASVFAKVSRDRMMLRLDEEFPEYGFARHKGYPTKAHCDKLRIHGPCPAHRTSFAPVAQLQLFS